MSGLDGGDDDDESHDPSTKYIQRVNEQLVGRDEIPYVSLTPLLIQFRGRMGAAQLSYKDAAGNVTRHSLASKHTPFAPLLQAIMQGYMELLKDDPLFAQANGVTRFFLLAKIADAEADDLSRLTVTQDGLDELINEYRHLAKRKDSPQYQTALNYLDYISPFFDPLPDHPADKTGKSLPVSDPLLVEMFENGHVESSNNADSDVGLKDLKKSGYARMRDERYDRIERELLDRLDICFGALKTHDRETSIIPPLPKDLLPVLQKVASNIVTFMRSDRGSDLNAPNAQELLFHAVGDALAVAQSMRADGVDEHHPSYYAEMAEVKEDLQDVWSAEIPHSRLAIHVARIQNEMKDAHTKEKRFSRLSHEEDAFYDGDFLRRDAYGREIENDETHTQNILKHTEDSLNNMSFRIGETITSVRNYHLSEQPQTKILLDNFMTQLRHEMRDKRKQSNPLPLMQKYYLCDIYMDRFIAHLNKEESRSGFLSPDFIDSLNTPTLLKTVDEAHKEQGYTRELAESAYAMLGPQILSGNTTLEFASEDTIPLRASLRLRVNNFLRWLQKEDTGERNIYHRLYEPYDDMLHTSLSEVLFDSQSPYFQFSGKYTETPSGFFRDTCVTGEQEHFGLDYCLRLTEKITREACIWQAQGNTAETFPDYVHEMLPKWMNVILQECDGNESHIAKPLYTDARRPNHPSRKHEDGTPDLRVHAAPYADCESAALSMGEHFAATSNNGFTLH